MCMKLIKHIGNVSRKQRTAIYIGKLISNKSLLFQRSCRYFPQLRNAEPERTQSWR